jgi:SAM-dependent methyltransferase
MSASATSLQAVQILRRIRNLGYWLLEPFDAVFRRINRLQAYPPIALRRQVGVLGTLDGVGREFVTYLRLLGGLKVSSKVWDSGCGCGLLELALEQSGWQGTLLGTDIHKPCIQWAGRTISRRQPSFRFEHADIYNAAYWPRGKLTAREWFAQFHEGDFDLIVAKSLFTHMLPDELELYLSEIARRLKPSGSALLTFFLLNEEQRALEARGKNEIGFIRQDDRYSVRLVQAPTAAVGYDEKYLLGKLQASGLKSGPVLHYGTWSGRADGLSFQDIILVQRR